ncbi:MAG: ATP-binding cassette domain-containing protein, partial [Bacilli bacterium]
ERVVNKIIEIDNGKLFTYGKNYDDYVQLKLQKEEMEAASFKKLQVFLRKELEWIMRGPQGRGTKSKNRIENFHELSNIKAKEKSSLELVYNTSRLGKKIVEISRVSKNINNNQLIQDFSYIINDDDRIGIVGPNGTGKTTLLNIISGISKVDKGKVDIGETVNFGYFKQESVIKDDKIRVIDFISENVIVVNDSNISPTKLLDKFLFTKEQQYTYINKLSGGERRRLLLLKVLIDNPNVLLLDEATNDFDIDTIMVLENFINEFKGPVIMVSHDRYFLDHLCNKIFYINKNGVIDIYNGNYSDNEDDLLSQEPTNNKKDNYRVKEKAIKLTFNERKELDEIENIINELENKVTLLEKEILDNYADYKVIEPLIKEKEELNTILDNKLMRWEYLLTKEETSK